MRLAMSELERRGAIYRIQGKGSFVASVTEDDTDALLSFDFWTHCDGIDRDAIKVEVNDLSVRGVSIVTSQMLGCRSSDGITHLEVAYRLDGAAIAVDQFLFSPDASGVSYCVSDGLHGCLLELEKNVASIREEYLMASLSIGDAVRFDCKSGPALQINHYAYDGDGRLIFIVERKVLSSRVSYQNIAFKS